MVLLFSMDSKKSLCENTIWAPCAAAVMEKRRIVFLVILRKVKLPDFMSMPQLVLLF